MNLDNTIPKVDSCLCGLISLKTGCYIIAVVTFLLELGGHGFVLTYSHYEYDVKHHHFYREYDYIWDYSSTSDRVIYNIYAIMIIFGLVASVLLIFGVCFHRRGMVLFFLIVYFVLVILTIILVIWSLLQDTQNHYYVNDIAGVIIYTALIIYFLIIVYSYYDIMT